MTKMTQDLRDRCKRIVDAYSVQLKNDFDWNAPVSSWTKGKVPFLWFVGCSGAGIGSIPGQITDLDNQIKAWNSPAYPDVVPKFATLTIGGNNAGFFDVVTKCVYHPDLTHNYGPDYPDKDGDCAKAIDASYAILKDTSKFAKPVAEALKQILTYDRVVGDKDFKVFLTNYAAFFNQDDLACDRIQFFSNGPLLFRDLRKAINDLVKAANAVLEGVVNGFNTGLNRTAFVNFDDSFDGHRFCEKTPTYIGPPADENKVKEADQRFKSNFWSFSPFDTKSNTANSCDPDIADCVNVDTSEYDGEVFTSSPDVGGLPSVTRVFHPKKAGFTGIKDTLKEVITSVMQFSQPDPNCVGCN